MLNFPYAISEFDKIISRKQIYLDRTQHIPFIEDWGDQLLFLRPRRFGKTLWISILMHYYDVAKADDFEKLFGSLSIGQNPTPLHNQYLVMNWDFSEISPHDSIQQIEEELHDHINEWIAIFADKYRDLFKTEIRINPRNSLVSFKSAVAAANFSPYKLYLFIDEYDNFANEVMMGDKGQNQQRYISLVQGEGIFKTLFKNIKSAASGKGLDRVFITGVSPVVMNDITSGPNTFKDITWRENLNTLCGFTQAEVIDLLKQVAQGCGLSDNETETIRQQMQNFYNGSRFVTYTPDRDLEEIPKVYNPTLTFYFLEEFQDRCAYPEDMLDGNLTPDSNKLAYIAQRTQGQPLLLDALYEQDDVTVSTLNRRFGVKDLMRIDQQRENLAILLTYLGALTVGGRVGAGNIRLEIPNLVMRRLYGEQILEMMTDDKGELLTEAHTVAEIFFGQGDIEPLCGFVEERLLSVYSNRDYREFDELTLKSLFIALLYYKNIYVMDSEPAILRQYGDLIMMLRPGMRDMGNFDFLLEFKFVKLGDLLVDKRVLSGLEVKEKSRSELADVAAVKSQMDQAKKQLKLYRVSLHQKYGAALKLRTFAVVGIGMDRVLFEEVF